jgi:hypothetical protein
MVKIDGHTLTVYSANRRACSGVLYKTTRYDLILEEKDGKLTVKRK